MIISDLHIHSRFSRACSKNITIDKLEASAKIKGVDLLGTGDFTHPKWIEEVKEKLKEDDSGILRTKNNFPFLLQSEVSLMYSQDGKGRKVHHIILAPSLEVVNQITEMFLKRGRVDYDGRPIFGMSSIELLDNLRSISHKIEMIPAHAWTPWFGIFGSNSGFDTLKQCFQEKTKHIHAIETGLSSDLEMNWRLSQLDKINLVSFSDMHSYHPWRLGREATMFDCKLTYDNILKAIRTREGLGPTVEVEPAYGKYHWDGHRNCNVSLSPKETEKNKGICPKCNKPVTIGVEYRVEQLADRAEGYVPKNSQKFYKLIPLSELISLVVQKGITTKTVSLEFDKLLNNFNNEFNILLNVSKEDLQKVVTPRLADIIIKNREGKLKVKPGYDGVYGEVQL
ncbi:MAG: endonuclease Q family protein [archaeon]